MPFTTALLFGGFGLIAIGSAVIRLRRWQKALGVTRPRFLRDVTRAVLTRSLRDARSEILELSNIALLFAFGFFLLIFGVIRNEISAWESLLLLAIPFIGYIVTGTLSVLVIVFGPANPLLCRVPKLIRIRATRAARARAGELDFRRYFSSGPALWLVTLWVLLIIVYLLWQWQDIQADPISIVFISTLLSISFLIVVPVLAVSAALSSLLAQLKVGEVFSLLGTVVGIGAMLGFLAGGFAALAALTVQGQAGSTAEVSISGVLLNSSTVLALGGLVAGLLAVIQRACASRRGGILAALAAILAASLAQQKLANVSTAAMFRGALQGQREMIASALRNQDETIPVDVLIEMTATQVSDFHVLLGIAAWTVVAVALLGLVRGLIRDGRP